jgi:hypothetical protein
MTIEEKRTELAIAWQDCPALFRDSFQPIFEAVVILLDERQEELARDAVAAIPTPLDFDAESQAEFEETKTAFVTGLEELIAIRDAEDPTKSPEYIAAYLAAQENRLK